jgi:tetratricopeptide (TPR) repeat protein
MKRLGVIVLGGVFLLSGGPLRAEDPPYLEFVRGLRERHYPDLALEYLKKISKDAPPDVAARLPLEMARTRLDIAVNTPDLGQRMNLYAEARTEFEQFIAKNAQSPLVNAAKLEVARVAVLQGKTQLGRALREEGPNKLSEAEKARKLLESAGTQLQAVVPLIEAQLAKYPDAPATKAEAAEKKEVEQARIRAELDLGINRFDEAFSYVDLASEEVLKKRAKIIEEAIPILKKAGGRDEREPLCWEAQAWMGRCYLEKGEPETARSKFNDILESKERAADAGKRLARYFRLLVIQEAPKTGENKTDLARDIGSRWVKDYPNYLNTPEGFGIRYFLAEADIQLAAASKVPAQRTSYLREAKQLCKDLEQVENEFTVRARKLKIGIIQEEGGLKEAVEKLTTFDDCYVRAQYEDAQLEGKKVTEEERKQHLKTLIAALNRGLDLVKTKNQKAPDEDLNNARAALAFAYMKAEDPVGAVRVGEELARLPARPSQSSRGAIYALYGYSAIVSNPGQNVGAENVKEYKEKMRDFGEFVKKSWPKDAPGDVARHELGLLYLRDENYAAAADELASIRPGYSLAVQTHYQLACAAEEAAKKKLPPSAADPKPWDERAVAALKDLPPLPKGADAGTTYTWLLGKIKLGQHLYKAKKYDEMEALSQPLLAQLPQLTLHPGDMQDTSRSGLESVWLYSKFGRAENEYLAGHYDKVGEIMDPVVEDARAGKMTVLKDNASLRWALLGLALRAYIQSGKLDQAQKVLDVLMSFSAGNDAEGATGTLLSLSQLLETQVKEMRKKSPDQLPKVMPKFSEFIDKLTKQQEKGKGLTPGQSFSLAQSYSALENHKRAAEMLNSIPEPKAEAPEKEKGLWQAARVKYVHELELDKQLDEADKEMAKIMGTKESPGWGTKNIEALKQRIFLIEAREKWLDAARQWDSLIKTLLPKVNMGLKDQYFECYFYLVRAAFRHGQNTMDAKKRAANIKQAATFIVTLESKWPDLGGDASKQRFLDLMEAEPELKDSYDQQKVGAPAK